tara:strand:+ start:180 stop:428 length:249 start_codon:yes stop_codon:yes gene_type:complete
MAKKKKADWEIREDLIEIRSAKPAPPDYAEYGEDSELMFLESVTDDVHMYDEEELYREAKKEGIDIYEPEPKKTKRKGDRLM